MFRFSSISFLMLSTSAQQFLTQLKETSLSPTPSLPENRNLLQISKTKIFTDAPPDKGPRSPILFSSSQQENPIIELNKYQKFLLKVQPPYYLLRLAVFREKLQENNLSESDRKFFAEQAIKEIELYKSNNKFPIIRDEVLGKSLLQYFSQQDENIIFPKKVICELLGFSLEEEETNLSKEDLIKKFLSKKDGETVVTDDDVFEKILPQLEIEVNNRLIFRQKKNQKREEENDFQITRDLVRKLAGELSSKRNNETFSLAQIIDIFCAFSLVEAELLTQDPVLPFEFVNEVQGVLHVLMNKLAQERTAEKSSSIIVSFIAIEKLSLAASFFQDVCNENLDLWNEIYWLTRGTIRNQKNIFIDDFETSKKRFSGILFSMHQRKRQLEEKIERLQSVGKTPKSITLKSLRHATRMFEETEKLWKF